MMGTGKAVAANIWGKTKAVMYAVSGLGGIVYVSVARLMENHDWMIWAEPILLVLFALSALASLASFITYMHSIFKSGALSHMTR